MKKNTVLDSAPHMPEFDKIAETWRVQFYPELERDAHGDYYGEGYADAQNTLPNSLLIVADTMSEGISTAHWYTFTKEWPGGVDHTHACVKFMRNGKCHRVSGDGDEFAIEGFWRVPRAAGDSHLHTICTSDAGVLVRLEYGLINCGDAIIEDGYMFAFCWNLDRCSISEINDMLRASATSQHYIVAISTTGDQRGLTFRTVLDISKTKPAPATPGPNPKTKTTKERMTPDQLATQFAIFADEVKPEHQALCTQALVKGEEAALKFLKMVDRNAKWIVARDHCTWRRRLSRMPCTGTDRGPKSWTQTTLVQWYYIEGRDIVTKT